MFKELSELGKEMILEFDKESDRYLTFEEKVKKIAIEKIKENIRKELPKEEDNGSK